MLKKLFGPMAAAQVAARAQRIRSALSAPFRKELYSAFLDTTNGCNLRCTFCTRDNASSRAMSAGELEVILGKIHDSLSALQLSCAWEYSIAKNAAEIIRTLGKYSIPSTAIYTNGNILTDEIACALIEVRLNDLVVSIGEAKPETYQRLRRGGKFERVVANIARLQQLKGERGSSFPRVCANLTLVNSNLGELVDFVELAHSIGIEKVTGRHLILNQGLDMSGEIVRDTGYANSVIDAAEKKALGYGISFSIPRYGEPLEPKSCRAPWQQLYISSNGDLSVCPRIHLHARVGNLLSDDFDTIRRGKEMKSLKRQFERKKFANPVCGICMENRETEQPIDQGF